MRTQFIEQGNAKAGKTVADIPVAPYLGFLLRVRGTTDTGETLTLEDIGGIRVERNGEQIQSQDFKFYHEYIDLKKGHPKTVSGSAASAEDVVAVVPAFYGGLVNVLDVTNQEELDITLDFDASTLSTRFGTNDVTYELYGLVEQSVSEKYVLDIRTQNIQASSDGRLSETLNRKNIAGLYFEDENDNVDEIQVDVDGEMVWDNIDQDLITIVTNLSNQIETAGNSLGEVNLVETGDIREAFNKNTQLDINFNASGTLDVTIASITASKKTQQSRQRAQQYLNRKQRNLAQAEMQ